VFPQWWRMLDGAAQMWVAVSQMMAMRGARIADSGVAPLADGRRELTRMVTEKTAAGGESAMSVTAQLWRTNWELAFVPLRWWAAWARAANGIAPAVTSANLVQGATAPPRRRVAANAKRLSNARTKRLTRRKHR
jgi:hypothetical protein